MIECSQAISGLNDVFATKVSLVPLKEMTDVLKTTRKAPALKRGDWVRMKRGIYKGDLAQVSLIHILILSNAYSYFLFLAN
jgi:hypothetical protein